MKKLALSILAFGLALAMAMAQKPAQGSVFLGTSTSLWGGFYTMQDLSPANNIGISFTKNKLKYNDETIDGGNYTCFNFSPRIGYALANGFVAGVKIDILSMKIEDEFKETISGVAGGPFARYFIATQGSAKPFFEAEATFGRLTDKYGENTDKTNTTHFTGGAGIAFFFNENVAFDVLAGYTYSTVKYPESNSDLKEITKGFGLGIGLTVFLNAQ